ncbi:MAG: alpha/beta hydrolase [Acidobacteriaceae bacterium]|nr:alpha/beta hydrolase [Acidobacteriaceae bacterium]
MPRRIESLYLQGPAGRLEALLEEPESGSPREAALVCHPHPQHGGTMHNKVVYRLARALRKSDCVVLRFNYRGVNLSEGSFGNWQGEAEDARAALTELRHRYPALPVLLAGFSFGSRIALKLAVDEPGVSRTIAVGFPTRYPNREYVHCVRGPKYFVQSTHDQFGPRDEFAPFFDSLPPPKHLDWVEACDHFFNDNLGGFEHVIERIGMAR